jgi:hypothetical protein
VVGQSLVLLDICPCSGDDVEIPSWCPDLSSQPVSRDLGSSSNFPVTSRQPALRVLLFSEDDDENSNNERWRTITQYSQRYISASDDDRQLVVRGHVIDEFSKIVEDRN